MSTDQFYRDFEAAFRGNRQEIIGRLEVYVDFLTPALELASVRRAIDLGCGRGEWLELLGRLGFSAHGVDLDAGMLEDCHALGLSAEQGDAIAHLRNLPAESQLIVSGFHIAEHLPFEVLQDLIRQALRVLKPGGLLILETPNPENLRVGTLSFHMDPTHNKPLPPGLLSFLPRHYGFERSQVVRLQESASLRAAPAASLFDVFEGVSPDYAVVAQKYAAPDVLAKFDAAFGRDRGLTLETLAGRFEGSLASKQDLQKVDRDMQKIDNDLQDLRAEYHERIEAVYASTSWRVTRPIRVAARLLASGNATARMQADTAKNAVRSAALGAVIAVHKQPVLRKALVSSIRAVPGLEGRLRLLLSAGRGATFKTNRQQVSGQLTPRAQDVYSKIQQLRSQR